LVVSLSLWFVLAVAVVYIKSSLPSDIQISLGIGLGGTIALFSFALFLTMGHPAAAPSGKNPVSRTTLVFRGLLAGIAVFVAIMLTMVNDVAAGIAMTFPSIFCTTMISLWISQDSAVSVGAIGPLILGSVSVPFYSMLFCLCVIVLQSEIRSYGFVLALSAFIGWFGSIIGISFPSYVLLQFKNHQQEQEDQELVRLDQPDENTRLITKRAVT